MNLEVTLAGKKFKNPVTTASGTFGSGAEYEQFVDLAALGAVTTKGVANVPWEGNPTPRVAETYGGMLNAVGLQNPGYELFAKRDIPYLQNYDTNIIVNVCGRTTEDYIDVVEKLGDEKVDMTTEDASITNSTSVMMTTVAGDENAIGYISLGSLNDTVKAVKIDGAEASAENVANDTYKVSRPFNIITTDKLSDAAQDFENYIMSADGQQIVEDNGYIKVADDAKAYEQSDAEGKVVVAGSSSVTPVMEKLKEAYEKANGGKITVEVQQSDSTTGITSAAEGICDIGMASRELKDEETKENLTATEIARDGIAVVVNNDNDIDELTSDQVKAIFTGETTDWEDLAK